MSLYGIYGEHTVERCASNNVEVAKQVIATSERDLTELMKKCKINKIVNQYHSAFEHTLLWVVDAEDAHLIQDFAFESGMTAINKIKIVPLITFKEGVVPLAKKVVSAQLGV